MFSRIINSVFELLTLKLFHILSLMWTPPLNTPVYII